MKLVINADDFGLSKSITDGIVYGIQQGCITSTTVMINMDYAKYAIEQAIKNHINCVGLHINLTVGKPIIPNKALTDDNGVFLYGNKQIENQKLTESDVYNEIMAQIKLFDAYSNGKIKIDHLDWHHTYLVNNEAIKNAIFSISKQLNLPLRNGLDIGGGICLIDKDYDKVKTTDTLISDFTINNVSVDTLIDLLEKNKAKRTAELMTHPGYIDEHTKKVTSYLGRENELNCLLEAKQKGVFDRVDLCSWSQL